MSAPCPRPKPISPAHRQRGGTERNAPLVVVNTLGIDDELLDRLARVRLERDHDPRREQEAIERHPLHAIQLLAPLS